MVNLNGEDVVVDSDMVVNGGAINFMCAVVDFCCIFPWLVVEVELEGVVFMVEAVMVVTMVANGWEMAEEGMVDVWWIV